MHRTYRVLLVDDHRLMREAAKVLIERSVEFRVVAEADGCEHALALLQGTVPDLIVVSMPVPHLQALDAAKQLGRQFKDARIVMISMLARDAMRRPRPRAEEAFSPGTAGGAPDCGAGRLLLR